MIVYRTAAISGSNSSAIVYIRGIGQGSSISTIDLGVGTYVDGVYLARSVGGVLDLVDVERKIWILIRYRRIEVVISAFIINAWEKKLHLIKQHIAMHWATLQLE